MATKKFTWSGYVGARYYYYYDDDGDARNLINEDAAKKVTDYLEANKNDDAYITISSGGGDAFTAAAIVGILESYRSRITVEAIGLVASAASIIAVAGSSKVLARSSSIIMIHEAQGFTFGGVAEHESNLSLLRLINNNAANVYSERSNLSLQEAKDAMKAETWYSAEEAKEAGLVQEILEPDDAVTEASVKEVYQVMRKAYNKMSKHHTQQIREDSILMRVPSAPVINNHSEEETMANRRNYSVVAGSTGGETTPAPATPAHCYHCSIKNLKLLLK